MKAYRGAALWRLIWRGLKIPAKPGRRMFADGIAARGVVSGSESKSTFNRTKASEVEKGPWVAALLAAATAIAPPPISAAVNTVETRMLPSPPFFMTANIPFFCKIALGPNQGPRSAVWPSDSSSSLLAFRILSSWANFRRYASLILEVMCSISQGLVRYSNAPIHIP